MNVQVNAWEWTTEEDARRALAGHSTTEAIIEDRKYRAAELISLFTITPNKTGFEIGSGNGLVAKLIASQCSHLDCNDISRSFIETAMQECAAATNVTFHGIPERGPPLSHLPSDHYDFGYSLNVFIHFNSYDVFNNLREVRRILKPGGMFFFDACTLGHSTASIFKEHADHYQQFPESVRGLQNYNSPGMLSWLIHEAALYVADITLAHSSWLKVLVVRPPA